MRAKDFINENTDSAAYLFHTLSDDQPMVNPGKRVGSDGTYKWSPPLQQQLDLIKDIAGVSSDEVTAADAEADVMDHGCGCDGPCDCGTQQSGVDDQTLAAVIASTSNHGVF